MSKKHFETIAAALANSKPFFGSPSNRRYEQWQRDVLAMADVCSEFNNNFNRSRFLSACGYEE
jgi:hypothetical protein